MEIAESVDFVEGVLKVMHLHGRVVGAYLYALGLARYEALKSRASEVLLVGELDDDTVAAIETDEYGVEPR